MISISSISKWLVFCIVGIQITSCDNNELAPISAVQSGLVPICQDSEVPVRQQIDINAISIETVATGLEVPWDLAVIGDGRILVTERNGRIRLIGVDGGLREKPWAEIPVIAQGIVGLMGIAVSPNFGETGYVYVVGTYSAVGNTWLERFLHKAKRAVLSPFSAGYSV